MFQAWGHLSSCVFMILYILPYIWGAWQGSDCFPWAGLRRAFAQALWQSPVHGWGNQALGGTMRTHCLDTWQGTLALKPTFVHVLSLQYSHCVTQWIKQNSHLQIWKYDIPSWETCNHKYHQDYCQERNTRLFLRSHLLQGQGRLWRRTCLLTNTMPSRATAGQATRKDKRVSKLWVSSCG